MGVDNIEHEPGENVPAAFETKFAWKGGLLAGVVATIVMGVAISVMALETLRVAIAGLYGFEGSLLAGWAAHLVHGALFGLIFAAFLADPALHRVGERVWKSILAGAVYGLVLTVIGAGIIMPMWLDFVGFQNPPGILDITTATLVWHLVYGAVLGALFPYAKGVGGTVASEPSAARG